MHETSVPVSAHRWIALNLDIIQPSAICLNADFLPVPFFCFFTASIERMMLSMSVSSLGWSSRVHTKGDYGIMRDHIRTHRLICTDRIFNGSGIYVVDDQFCWYSACVLQYSGSHQLWSYIIMLPSLSVCFLDPLHVIVTPWPVASNHCSLLTASKFSRDVGSQTASTSSQPWLMLTPQYQQPEGPCKAHCLYIK